MRPVDRGTAPQAFTAYQDARNHLLTRIGWYCSYCEMPIKNMPEVEHMLPVNQGGDRVDWDNFLLSCKYCNTIKSDHNATLHGYFWPDRDNTFRAFRYEYGSPISAASSLTAAEQTAAQATITLCGLDRQPGTAAPPTARDTRWLSRDEAWRKAMQAREDWSKVLRISRSTRIKETMADFVAAQATGEGHFSIWMEVFQDDPVIRRKLIEAFPGTAKDCFDPDTQFIKRPTGNL